MGRLQGPGKMCDSNSPAVHGLFATGPDSDLTAEPFPVQTCLTGFTLQSHTLQTQDSAFCHLKADR